MGDPVVPLSLERFRLLRDLINRRFGIFFTDDDRYLMESRLSERLVHLGITTFDDYYHYLMYHPSGDAETEAAAEILTTNETYFFREEYQLRSFARELLPRLQDRLGQRRRLMVWSAGCSSGEEAYTVAMLIKDSGLFNGSSAPCFSQQQQDIISMSYTASVRRHGPATAQTT